MGPSQRRSNAPPPKERRKCASLSFGVEQKLDFRVAHVAARLEAAVGEGEDASEWTVPVELDLKALVALHAFGDEQATGERPAECGRSEGAEPLEALGLGDEVRSDGSLHGERAVAGDRWEAASAARRRCRRACCCRAQQQSALRAASPWDSRAPLTAACAPSEQSSETKSSRRAMRTPIALAGAFLNQMTVGS